MGEEAGEDFDEEVDKAMEEAEKEKDAGAGDGPAASTEAACDGILPFAGGVVFGALVVLVVLLLRKKDSREIAGPWSARPRPRRSRTSRPSWPRPGQLRRPVPGCPQGQHGRAPQAGPGEPGRRIHLGEKDLETKKQLIDQNLSTMKTDVQKMQELVSRFEAERARQYGELDTQLKSAARETSRLQETAGHLREALVSTKARGQWGERMAETCCAWPGSSRA